MNEKYADLMLDKSNYFTEAQMNRILSVAKHRGHKHWLILYLLKKTGRRVSEVLPLKPQDIDFDKGLISFIILKKRKPLRKWKACDTKTLTVLKKWIIDYELDKEAYFFESSKLKGKHYTRKWAFDLVRNTTYDAEVTFQSDGSEKFYNQKRNIVARSGWHPHHFRHSFAILFLTKHNSSKALIILSEILEHSNIEITKGYLQFSQQDTINALNKVFEDEE